MTAEEFRLHRQRVNRQCAEEMVGFFKNVALVGGAFVLHSIQDRRADEMIGEESAMQADEENRRRQQMLGNTGRALPVWVFALLLAPVFVAAAFAFIQSHGALDF